MCGLNRRTGHAVPPAALFASGSTHTTDSAGTSVIGPTCEQGDDLRRMRRRRVITASGGQRRETPRAHRYRLNEDVPAVRPTTPS